MGSIRRRCGSSHDGSRQQRNVALAGGHESMARPGVAKARLGTGPRNRRCYREGGRTTLRHPGSSNDILRRSPGDHWRRSAKPEVLFRPSDFACEEGAWWHAEDRFLVVRATLSSKTFWRTRYAVPPCVFDLTNRTFTLVPVPNSHYIYLARSHEGWTVEESPDRPKTVASRAGDPYSDRNLRWVPWDGIASASERFFEHWFDRRASGNYTMI